MKVELKVREGGVVSPARRQLLSALRQTISTMSLCCVKVPLKARADATISSIYAPKSELYHEIVFSFTTSGVSGHFPWRYNSTHFFLYS